MAENKEIFIKTLGISDAVPKDPEAKIIPAIYFAEAVDEFLCENFKGCIRVTRDTLGGEAILVCGDYAAYLFKLILTGIYGRTLLNMRIFSNDQELIMTIDSESKLPLTDSEFRSIIKAARNAGIDALPTERGITLSLKYKNASSFKIYAISPTKGKLYIKHCFTEMFYTISKS